MIVDIGEVKVEKRIGPKTEPCGTPVVTGDNEDRFPSTLTNWDRSDRYDLIQESAESCMPKLW